jgi:hypothetical protein
MAFLGFILICIGIGMIAATWSFVMLYGWVGGAWERKELRNPRSVLRGK